MSLSLFSSDPFHGFFGGYPSHSLMTSPFTSHSSLSRSSYFSESEDNYTMSFETPGLGPSDIRVELHDNNFVTVSGSRNDNTDQSRSRYSFSQTVRLPRNSDTHNISATVDRGILTLDVAKIPRPETVSIPVTGTNHNSTENVDISQQNN